MDTGNLKNLLKPYQTALYDLDGTNARDALVKIAGDAQYRMCHPFGEFTDAGSFYDATLAPLAKAWPDLERRDTIIMAGEDEDGAEWIGCAGYYSGTFIAPWLTIPPTGHIAHMRFAEFYRIKDGRVAEFQGIWDIPEVMMQARAWPLSPSLGREWHVPAPATQDGLAINGTDAQAIATRQHIIDMLKAMSRHPVQPPTAMELPRFWHPKMNWYGPSGIGTGRGMAGFRHWHQIPFLRAMPDRGQKLGHTNHHFFAEGNYAAVTGWPNMMQTLQCDGWLGLPPLDKTITLCSLDFWRLEAGLIRENWVLIDLLDIYRQIGVDVFARLGEFNKARLMGAIDIKKDYT